MTDVVNDLCLHTATELRQLITSGEVSCVEVLDAHISRIEEVNPSINAIVTQSFESARKRASELDQSRQTVGLLHGLPIAHKDLVLTKGIRTTFGSVLHKDFVPADDEVIVKRIREAGAVCVGKTNVPEFGAGSHTFNRVFGATGNPYDPSRTCGGSSGGAAASLAARMIPIADGSDFGGSLRNPGAFCNVIGFRPSPGRVPTTRRSNPWSDLAVYGPMGRTIDDTALLFAVMAGPVDGVHGMLETEGRTFHPVESRDLNGLKVAFSLDFGGLPVEPGIKDTLSRFVLEIESAGAQVEEHTPDFKDATSVFQVLRGLEYRRRYVNASKSELKELKETILWNLELGRSLTLEDVEQAIAARRELIQRMVDFFNEFDVLVGPATQVMPFPIETDWVREINGVRMSNYIEWMNACCWLSLTASPALSLPAGFHDGLPVGAQIVAPLRHDRFLLSVAKAMEEVTNHWRTIPMIDT